MKFPGLFDTALPELRDFRWKSLATPLKPACLITIYYAAYYQPCNCLFDQTRQFAPLPPFPCSTVAGGKSRSEFLTLCTNYSYVSSLPLHFLSFFSRLFFSLRVWIRRCEDFEGNVQFLMVVLRSFGGYAEALIFLGEKTIIRVITGMAKKFIFSHLCSWHTYSFLVCTRGYLAEVIVESMTSEWTVSFRRDVSCFVQCRIY